MGIIGEFYIVGPDQYAAARQAEMVRPTFGRSWSAPPKAFSASPTSGGASAETGFDCSGPDDDGLSAQRVRYPPHVGDQFAVGSPVGRSSLAKGDLIFFGQARGQGSHVGVYAGMAGSSIRRERENGSERIRSRRTTTAGPFSGPVVSLNGSFLRGD